MLNNNTIYYIESIKIKGKEISEENPIWIKCETWQWGSIMAGRGKQKEISYEKDICFSQWEMPSNIYIKSSIHLFNAAGGFAEMFSYKDNSENNEVIEIELKALKTDYDQKGNPLLPVEIQPKDTFIVKSTFQEIIESNFMIADHLVIPHYMENSETKKIFWDYHYSALQKIWSGESEEINNELLTGIFNEESDSDKIKCFGESPIAFPPKYQNMSVMEDGVLSGQFDGENIFRWYGRTEGAIIGVDCDFGKTIKYSRSDRENAVFNDYEKSVIYSGKKYVFPEKEFGLSSLDNHVELKKNLVSIISFPDNVYNQFTINKSKIELNGVHVCQNEGKYLENYTDSKLVFLKDESKFIFSNDIDDLFGYFKKPKRITKREKLLLSKIAKAIENNEINYTELIEHSDDKLKNTKSGFIVFQNLYCSVEKGDRTLNLGAGEGWQTKIFKIKVGKKIGVLYEGSSSYALRDIVGSLTLNIKTNEINIEPYNYESYVETDTDIFFKSLNAVAEKDFKIASVAWYNDYQRVIYARKKKEEFNYVILDRDEWEETKYFQNLITENALDENSEDYWDKCSILKDEIYNDLCNDATLLAPKWFYD
ncbi:MAG: hypothetical protein CL832_10350 [Crocinitomicaceae bacterium]|nr:hypothetical protein [Crocinitomicaceae bacterium]